MFTTTLADLLSILEKATSGETGIHASGACVRALKPPPGVALLSSNLSMQRRWPVCVNR